jgi:betaine-aldehyde dehydrogenase
VHASIYDAVLARVKARAEAFKPGLPTDFATTMGAIVSKVQYDRVMGFIQTTLKEGGRLVCGGKKPDAPELANGYFIEPTIFADMKPGMTIATQEVFGPVLAVFKWEDEEAMLAEVNRVEYGLTCSIWTNNLQKAHRTAAEVQAGYVWINETSKHLLGAPFGGYKQSGIGREESLEELLAFTQEKHIHIRLS